MAASPYRPIIAPRAIPLSHIRHSDPVTDSASSFCRCFLVFSFLFFFSIYVPSRAYAFLLLPLSSSFIMALSDVHAFALFCCPDRLLRILRPAPPPHSSVRRLVPDLASTRKKYGVRSTVPRGYRNHTECSVTSPGSVCRFPCRPDPPETRCSHLAYHTCNL